MHADSSPLKFSLHMELYRSLKDQISDGRLSAGERLPSANDFANSLMISRRLVLQCYELLWQEGFVDVTESGGIYVADLSERDESFENVAELPTLV